MQIRNPAYLESGDIDCEVEHPQLGWLPFTASPNDPEQHGRDVFTAAVAMTPTAYVAPTVSLADQKAGALAALAARRYHAEISGATFGGNAIPTDRVTQAKLTAAYIKASADVNYQIANWKSPDGTFATLDAVAITALANAVHDHVQACFDHEATLSAAINAATDATELAAVNLETGWP